MFSKYSISLCKKTKTTWIISPPVYVHYIANIKFTYVERPRIVGKIVAGRTAVAAALASAVAAAVAVGVAFVGRVLNKKHIKKCSGQI